jgi:hypothetical protein
MRCVAGYRWNVQRLQNMGVLDVWYLHAYPGRKNPLVETGSKAEAVFAKAMVKAMQQTNATLLGKTAERSVDGAWRLKEDPPVLMRVDRVTREKAIEGLNAYAPSLSLERRYLFSRYHVVDVGRRVVGVGSIGSWVGHRSMAAPFMFDR